jgi:Ase1/PRC1/MAP65 family protein
MLEMKRQSMSAFIGNARAEIELLWEDLVLSQDERTQFYPFFDGSHRH